MVPVKQRASMIIYIFKIVHLRHQPTHCIGFDRFHWIEHVVRRRRWTGQMVDLVHLNEKRIDNIMVDEFKVFVSQPMLHVALTSRKEVVGHDYFVALHHELIDQVRAYKSSSTRYQNALPIFKIQICDFRILLWRPIGKRGQLAFQISDPSICFVQVFLMFRVHIVV